MNGGITLRGTCAHFSKSRVFSRLLRQIVVPLELGDEEAGCTATMHMRLEVLSSLRDGVRRTARRRSQALSITVIAL